MEARLSDNPDSWVEEVLQEAHKQHSFLGQYDTSVDMREVDGEKAYGLGLIHVRTKSERLNTPAGQALAEREGNVSIRIPVIIKEGKLKSLDVFMDARGRPQPLTDRRARAALFRPNTFDSPGNPPVESTLLSPQLLPPDRAESQVLGRGAVSADGIKLSSERPLLLEAIAPTITQEDKDRLQLALNQDQELACQLIDKHAHLIQIISDAQPVSPHEIAQSILDNVPSDTFVLSREGESYLLKQANSQFYAPKSIRADRIQMTKIVGESLVKAADEMDSAMVTSDPVVADVSDDASPPAQIVDDYGQYKVLDSMGREHLGWVFPVTDFEGVALPLRIFTSGAASAVQGDIVGVLQSKAADPPSEDTLEGDGFFYRVTNTGGVQAFPPGTVRATFSDADGPAIRFETIMGEMLTLRLVPGLKQPAPIDAGTVGLPEEVRFCPLHGEALVLVGDPDVFVKPSDVEKVGSVRMFGDGTTWTFRGPAVQDVPPDQRTMMGYDDALLLSGALGMTAKVAQAKLARACYGGGCQVGNLRKLQTPAQHYLSSREGAVKLANALPKKELLIKEAADLQDPTTVDKVLALGFITPENISTLVSYLPDLEETIYKLCHLLISVRLDQNLAPEQSVSNAVQRLEETIVALRDLAFQGQTNA